MLPQVREKFSEPTFAVVIRIAALSPDEDEAFARASRLAKAITLVTASDANSLTVLESSTTFEEEAQDFLDRQTRRSGMLLSLSELLTLIHLPSAAVRSTRLMRHTARTKAAPPATREGGIAIGLNNHEEKDRPVRLTNEQRLRHVHIVGSSGSGKSTLLVNMAMEDLDARNGFAVLDPHGDVIDEIVARIPEDRAKDIVLFDPSDVDYPIGFNVLSARSELERTLLSSDFVATFRRLSSTTFGDQMVSVLGNAVLALLESPNGGTLLDLRRFLIDKSFRAEFLETVQDDAVRGYWLEEFPLIKGLPHASILTRLNTFLRPKVIRHMVAQKNDRLDFRAIMDGRKIFLAKLSHGLIGEENAHLFGSLLVSKFAQAAMSRQEESTTQRAPFFLYLDEFHHFVTPSVATILTSVRKYGLGLCLAHHELRQLKNRSEDVASAVLSNAYTRVVFRVAGDDARTLANGFSYFEPSDLENLAIGHAIARVERTEWDFNLRTILPEAVEAQTKAARMAAVRAASRSMYATTRAEVETVLGSATAVSKASTTSKETEKSKEPPKQTITIPTPAPSSPGRGGGQHKYLQSLIRRLAEDRGFDVTIEKSVLDGHGYVDVVLEKDDLSVACEISVTTRSSHEIANLSKCLAAGFNYAVLLSSDVRVLDQAREEFADEPNERLKFMLADDFIGFLDELAGTSTASPTKRKKGDQGRIVVDPASGAINTKRLLTTHEAAEYTGIARQTLAKFRVSGDSPPFHKIGRQVLYDKTELDDWIEQRRRRSTSDTGVPNRKRR